MRYPMRAGYLALGALFILAAIVDRMYAEYAVAGALLIVAESILHLRDRPPTV